MLSSSLKFFLGLSLFVILTECKDDKPDENKEEEIKVVCTGRRRAGDCVWPWIDYDHIEYGGSNETVVTGAPKDDKNNEVDSYETTKHPDGFNSVESTQTPDYSSQSAEIQDRSRAVEEVMINYIFKDYHLNITGRIT